MQYDLLELITELENSLASHYGKIKGIQRLKAARSVLEYMEMHSYAHGEIIEQQNRDLKEPQFKGELAVNYQRSILNTVFKQIQNEQDIVKIIKTLADSEKSLGMLYRSIAAYTRKLSDYYSRVADCVEEIAADEDSHSEILLEDRQRIVDQRLQEKMQEETGENHD